MHVVMRVEPAEPYRAFKPALPWHMHAEMEVLVEKVIEPKRGHAPKEDTRVKKMLNPKEQRHVQTENERRVPPSEPDFLAIFGARKKVTGSRAKDAVVN
jgi:hypothetical protein